MDAHIACLIQIKDSIKQAQACTEKGLARLQYFETIALLQKLSNNLNNCMLALESVGEQPTEILNDWYRLPNVETNILDFHTYCSQTNAFFQGENFLNYILKYSLYDNPNYWIRRRVVLSFLQRSLSLTHSTCDNVSLL